MQRNWVRLCNFFKIKTFNYKRNILLQNVYRKFKASICLNLVYKLDKVTVYTSFSTVFQSYQDDERLIKKGCVQQNTVYGWEDFASSVDRTRSARSVSQRWSQWAIGGPVLNRDFTKTQPLRQNAEYYALCYYHGNIGMMIVTCTVQR